MKIVDAVFQRVIQRSFLMTRRLSRAALIMTDLYVGSQ